MLAERLAKHLLNTLLNLVSTLQEAPFLDDLCQVRPFCNQ